MFLFPLSPLCAVCPVVVHGVPQPLQDAALPQLRGPHASARSQVPVVFMSMAFTLRLVWHCSLLRFHDGFFPQSHCVFFFPTKHYFSGTAVSAASLFVWMVCVFLCQAH